MFQVQPLSQMDPQWKNITLGNSPTSTIGVYGCLLTSLTMLVNGLGASETPATLNDKMRKAGGFQDDLLIPGVLSGAVPGYASNRFEKYPSQPAPMAEIDATLATGAALIIEVDYSPAAGLQTHWIVLLGKNGDDYLIQDPFPYPAETQQVLLTKRYGFAGAPQNIIKAALWIGKPVPAPKPAPVSIPTSGLVVYASEDGIALRTQPVIDDSTLILRVSPPTQLFVNEDATAAQAKIGVQGKWLQVIDADQGYPGYIAAWHVTTNAPQPTPAGSPILYTAADKVALRSQPILQDNTLIKREALNTKLEVLEPADQALKKVGVTGQWLQVKDDAGVQGYMAAWYVAQNIQPALGVRHTLQSSQLHLHAGIENQPAHAPGVG